MRTGQLKWEVPGRNRIEARNSKVEKSKVGLEICGIQELGVIETAQWVRHCLASTSVVHSQIHVFKKQKQQQNKTHVHTCNPRPRETESRRCS